MPNAMQLLRKLDWKHHETSQLITALLQIAKSSRSMALRNVKSPVKKKNSDAAMLIIR